ncbi:TorF family putative porin [Croceibacterium sp. LX-88]|uniref:TorF family putative porin n=1 Tax=Croceibacterium selenioxidans TaxID=2838833 RepID=A0ABS5W0Y2_9SPHN|nr:TorF family putative porin [Croceibacterium selenioxidans]MBT2132885.1 TorF family putative porin [Croceibacterium selenioxidans]
MLTSVRSLTAATLLVGTALAATPALAQDAEEKASPITVTGSTTLVTDYRFRGVGLSGGDIAIQGGLTLNTTPGFYVGTWASSLEDSPVYGEVELDIFGGWTGEVTDGLAADVGVTYYAYPSKDAGAGPSDVWEFYGKLKPTLGPVGLTFGLYYSPDQDSLGGGDNLYLSADAGVGIPQTPISFSAHVGYTDGFLTLTDNGKAWDWSVGASATVLGGLSLGLSYVGVEGSKINGSIDGVTDDTVVASLGYAF